MIETLDSLKVAEAYCVISTETLDGLMLAEVYCVIRTETLDGLKVAEVYCVIRTETQDGLKVAEAYFISYCVLYQLECLMICSFIIQLAGGIIRVRNFFF